MITKQTEYLTRKFLLGYHDDVKIGLVEDVWPAAVDQGFYIFAPLALRSKFADLERLDAV
jgi:hypothetical protein